MSDHLIEFKNSMAIISLPLNGASENSAKCRIDQVIPIIQQLINSDVAIQTSSLEDQTVNQSAVLALDISCQAHIHIALTCAERMKLIADGEAAIAEYGFPEFEDNGDMYDD